MIECDLALAADEEAAILPARRHRDEISRRGQLDVDPELFLQHWNRPEQTIVLWDNADVDVNRRPAPSEQDGRRSSREVHARFGVGCYSVGAHYPAPTVRICYRALFAARAMPPS